MLKILRLSIVLFTLVQGSQSDNGCAQGDNNNQCEIEGVSVLDNNKLEPEFQPNSPTEFNCTFEEGSYCGMTNSSVFKDATWENINNIEVQEYFGDFKDHTLHSEKGRLLFLREKSTNTSGYAGIVLPKFQTPACVSFWYILKAQTFLRFAADGEDFVILEDQKEEWTKFIFTLDWNNLKEAMFNADASAIGRGGYIAIDDIEIRSGECLMHEDQLGSLCTFQTDCGYTNETVNDITWEKAQQITALSDHTLNTPFGYFMYIHANPDKTGKKARLVSPKYTATSDYMCFKFFYHLEAEHIGTINILVKNSEGESLMWTRTRNYLIEIPPWDFDEATLIVEEKEGFQVIIEGILGNSTRGGMAIDDIRIVDGICPFTDYDLCKFDGFSECIWQNDPNNEINWELTDSKGDKNGPSSSDGSYMKLITRNKKGANGRFISDFISPENDRRCLSFRYFLRGNFILKVLLQSKNTTKTLWTLTGSQGSRWYNGLVPFHDENELYQLIFEGTFNVAGFLVDYLAIDNIEIKKSSCGFAPSQADPMLKVKQDLNCDFEKGSCKWSNRTSSGGKLWKLGLSKGSFKPAKNNRSYVFLEFNSSSYYGSQSEFFSKSIDNKNPFQSMCFSFGYYLFGPNAGSLEFLMEDLSGSKTNIKNSVTLWKRSSSQVDNWNYVNLTIASFPTKFTLTFRATLGTSGIMAIDDLIMSTGACEELKGCDFEGSMCGWYSERHPMNRWRISRASENSFSLLPLFDHSTKTPEGHYVYVNTNITGTTVHLFSPLYREGFGTQCLQFWYVLQNELDVSLNIFKKLKNSASVLEPSLWSQDNKGYNVWRFAQVTVKEYEAFQIIFQFSYRYKNDPLNQNPQAAVALDDIHIEMGPCSKWNLCTFDQNACGFESNATSKDEINWLRGFGRTSTPDLLRGPVTDHTMEGGYYMYADFPSSVTQKNAALLVSDFVDSLICIKLWYFITGSGTGYLKLGIEGTEEKDIINNKTSKWEEYKKIVPNYQSVRYIIEAVKEKGDIFIAVDDVILTPDSFACEDIQEPTIPPTVQADPDFFCDFENDTLCQWTTESVSGYKWSIHKSSVVINGNDLKYDHTTGNYLGKYAFYRTYRMDYMSTGSLLSPLFTKSSQYCLQFWYFLNGPSTNEFFVALNNTHENNRLWERFSNQGPIWRMAQIEFYAWQGEKIVFVMTTSIGSRSVVGLDDISVAFGHCPNQRTCSFDNGEWCGFINSEENPEYHQWRLLTAQRISNLKFPSDHTTDSNSGGYLYSNLNISSASQSKLFSPVYDPTENSCIKFWFFKNNEDTKLQIYINNQLHVEFQNYYADRWSPVTVSVQSKKAWQVEIRSYSTKRNSMTIGIDDFEVLDGECKSTDFCDFETGMCLWENDKKSLNQWQRASAVETTITTSSYELPIDHTLHSIAGHMLYMYKKSWSSGPNSQLFSRIFQKSELENDLCFSVWYYCSQTDVGRIEIMSTDNKQSVGSIEPAAAKKWIKKEFNITDIYDDLQVKLIFSPIGKAGFIALDDISFHSGTCKDLQFPCLNGYGSIPDSQVCDFTPQCLDGSDELNCGNCTFDNDYCGYSDITLLHWQKSDVNNKKLTENIPFDQATGIGKPGQFLYFDFDTPYQSTTTSRAILLSPRLQNSSPNCHLIFWNMIYFVKDGTSISKLKVSLMTDNHPNIVLWQNEAADLLWQQITLPIGRIESHFRIKFEVVFSRTLPEIIIALDDISFQHCSYPTPVKECSDEYFKCNNSACVDSSRICDLIDDCGDGSDESQCEGRKLYDFEDNIFGDWVSSNDNKNSRENKWKIASGSKQWYSPPRDHTLGNIDGKFVIIWNNLAVSNTTSYRLFGPFLKESTECKMRFNYFLYGKKGLFLNVLTNNTGSQTKKLNWQRTDPTGQYFVRDLIHFNETESFQVIFEAVFLGSSEKRSVALDDISFDGNCEIDNSTIPTTLPPTPSQCDKKNQFQCASLECVDLTKRCDFVEDCQDGSDERDCGSCQFETNSCGWKDRSYGKYRWIRSQVSNTLPKQKGATNNIMTIQYFPPGDFTNSVVILESPEISARGTQCTMAFSYYLNKNDVSLDLYFKHRNGTDFFVSSFSTVTIWKQQIVHLGQIPLEYKIRFVATVNPSAFLKMQLDIGIMDLTFQECTSDEPTDKTNLNCTFEEESCQWFQEYLKDNFDWKKGSGATPVKGTGPEFDHSYTNGSGHYMYIESFGKNIKSEKARLISSPTKSSTPECFSFWYHMFGMNVNRLNVYRREMRTNTESFIWTKMLSQGNTWKQAEIQLNYDMNTSYQIIFEGILGERRSDIALDDITLKPGLCEMKNFCDFEIDSCNWTVGHSITRNTWLLGRNGNQDLRSGPTTDHTTGTTEGYYAFVFVDKKSTKDPARFYSPTFPMKNTEQCFRFFYYVNSCRKAANLNVYLKTTNGEHPLQNISYSISLWQEKNIKIFASTEFQIIFEGIIGSTCGTIAIDDVMLLDSPCPPDNSCDFEHDICFWKNVDSLKWLRNSGGTPSEFTGPSVDHTYGTSEGYYLFLDSSTGKPGSTAILESQTLTFGKTACFKMWYFMSGEGVGKLSVKLKFQKEVFNISGHQDNKWIPVNIELNNLPSAFIIQLTATLGNKDSGDIAIDDVSIKAGSCSPDFTSATGSTEFTHMLTSTAFPNSTNCQSGFAQCNTSNEDTKYCIPSIYWCDGVKDCPDGEDEVNGCQNECLHNISNEQICDGLKDCSDASDETICDCRDDFCRKGTCKKEKYIYCKCEGGFKGKRCEVSSPLENSGLDKGSIAGIVMGSILAAVTALCIAGLYYRKQLYLRSLNNESNSIDNPMYASYTEDDSMDFSVLGASTSVSELRDMGVREEGAGVANPIYDSLHHFGEEFQEREIQ